MWTASYIPRWEHKIGNDFQNFVFAYTCWPKTQSSAWESISRETNSTENNEAKKNNQWLFVPSTSCICLENCIKPF